MILENNRKCTTSNVDGGNEQFFAQFIQSEMAPFFNTCLASFGKILSQGMFVAGIESLFNATVYKFRLVNFLLSRYFSGSGMWFKYGLFRYSST